MLHYRMVACGILHACRRGCTVWYAQPSSQLVQEPGPIKCFDAFHGVWALLSGHA